MGLEQKRIAPLEVGDVVAANLQLVDGSPFDLELTFDPDWDPEQRDANFPDEAAIVAALGRDTGFDIVGVRFAGLESDLNGRDTHRWELIARCGCGWATGTPCANEGSTQMMEVLELLLADRRRVQVLVSAACADGLLDLWPQVAWRPGE